MPDVEIVETFTIGPGLLKLKLAGAAAVSFEARLLAFTVDWSETVTVTEGRPVLSGGKTKRREKATYTASSSGRCLQDLESAGLLTWTWMHRGETAECLYVPNDDFDRAVQGEIRIVPFKLGGDVDVDGPESDFTWSWVEDPVIGDYDPVNGTVTPDV